MRVIKISGELIKELRKRSSAPVLHCKEALESSFGDVEKAMEVLREKGMLIAEKKLQRETNEGLIFSKINSERTRAVALEVACETDFVAKTKYF